MLVYPELRMQPPIPPRIAEISGERYQEARAMTNGVLICVCFRLTVAGVHLTSVSLGSSVDSRAMAKLVGIPSAHV
jgi:hypothetical protein